MIEPILRAKNLLDIQVSFNPDSRSVFYEKILGVCLMKKIFLD